MPAPTVTVEAPPPANYSDPGVLRPESQAKWTGGVGPFDVLHEWDTDPGFSGPITDNNAGVTSPNVGVPPSDMGPAGTTWHYRVTVTDTSDMTSTTSSTKTLDWSAAIEKRRYLYELASVGVAFYPIDTAILGEAVDGDAQDFRRYLYELGNVGVGFYPTDTAILGEAVDGDVKDFRRYLYELGNVDTTTPTPHIWYVFPSYGREGWEFRIIGYGFGDTQGTYSGSATLDGLGVSILTWELIGQTNANLIIDPIADIAQPVHQQIRTQVPIGASSGLVIVCTDGP